jgi:hypothetical protein
MLKVVGVGLNKTGTTTLGACMQHWELRHMPFHPEPFELWQAREWKALFKWADGLDSLADWPWALIYKELDRHYPGTKFILTRRVDAPTWFRSLCRHAEMTGPTVYREVIYGHAMPHAHVESHLHFYKTHLQRVRAYFADRPSDFLEVCWEEGDGWEQLAGFLGLEVPEIPFPHENKSR